MLLSSVPYKFATPWAQDAASPQLTAVITPTAASPAASQQLGFPPATDTPIGAGGTPPNIADFNGFGLYLSSWAQWVQAGGAIQYDATFSTNISGYPKAALLAATSLPGNYWVSTADNNTSNPDGGTPTNWQSLFANMFKTMTQYSPPDRQLGTVYTNTTGNPMQIAAVGLSTGPSVNLDVYVNSLHVWSQGAVNVGDNVSAMAMVPAGATYEVAVGTVTSSGITLQLWTEWTQA
jgi:hypothetical protein